MEKEVLGLYVSGHPLVQYQALLAGANTVSTAHLGEKKEDERVAVGGMITGTKKIITKNGSPMLFVTIEDLTGLVEVIVFPKVYERNAALLREDAIVLIRGRVSYKDEDPKIVADEVETLKAEVVTEIHVTVPPDLECPELFERLRAILELNSGPSPVYLHLLSCGKRLETDRQCWVRPDPDVLESLIDLLGPGTVSARPA
jgi:DNA polymerase-3 subunit alpha